MTYESVTPDQVTALVRELRNSGQGVTNVGTQGNEWRIEGHGITADAKYDSAAQALTVTVVSKPFFIPESAINGGILKALGRA